MMRGFCPRGFCPEGAYVLMELCMEGFCPRGFCPRGFCPRGFCPRGFCPEGVLSYLRLPSMAFILFIGQVITCDMHETTERTVVNNKLVFKDNHLRI